MIAQSSRSWGAVTAFAVATASATIGASSASPLQGYLKEEIERSFVMGEATANWTGPFIETIELDLTASDLVESRLSILEELDEDHDGEGASAPNPASVSMARHILTTLAFDAPVFAIGLTSDGNAVAEFVEDGSFGQLVFLPDMTIEAYFAPVRGESILLEGSLYDNQFRRDFVHAFGFDL